MRAARFPGSTSRASRRRSRSASLRRRRRPSPRNTPIAEIATLPDDTKRVLFEPTPPLPTYLVAFAVGPLDVADGGQLRDAADRTVPLRGLAAQGHGPEFGYALSNTPEIVALLADYFGQPYPFAKLDLVAVPSQQGAMENVGLITYGEYHDAVRRRSRR